MGLSVFNAFISMRSRGCLGNAWPYGFTKGSCLSHIGRRSSHGIAAHTINARSACARSVIRRCTHGVRIAAAGADQTRRYAMDQSPAACLASAHATDDIPGGATHVGGVRDLSFG